LEDLLKSGMINHQQFELQDTKNKVTLLQIPTPRISELPSSHETTTPGLVPTATKDTEKNGKLDNQNAALETTWWFLQGSNQNLEMFDKAMAHSKPSSYSLEYVIATGENYFFIWKLSDGKTAKEWGKWFLSSYRNAIGAPPPSSSSDSEDEDAAHVDTKNGEKNSENISEKNGEKNSENVSEKNGGESDRSGESEGEGEWDSSDDGDDDGDEIQISAPSIPPSWGEEDSKLGGLWYVGYKVVDFDKWTLSQARAPVGYNCVFYSRNINKDEEENWWMVHTVWRIRNGKGKDKIFRSFSDGLTEENVNLLILEMEEKSSRGF